MITAHAITQWFNTELKKISTDGNMGPVKILNNYSDRPKNLEQLGPTIIVETTQDTVETKAAGPMNPHAKLTREIYLQGLINVTRGQRPSDILDAFVFEVRATLYPASKQLVSGGKIQQISETECRYLLPDDGLKAAKFLMRFNVTYIENYTR